MLFKRYLSPPSQKLMRSCKWLTLFLMCLALFGDGRHAVQASSNAISITVDGAQTQWSTAPYIAYGTTYVPLRDAAASLGAQVRWNESANSAIVTRNGDTITYKLGSNIVNVNGYAWKQTSPLIYVRGTLTLPLRGITEPLRATVNPTKSSAGTQIAIDTDTETIRDSSVARVDAYLLKEGYSGMALVAKDGQVLLRKGYGPAGGGTFNRPDMPSRIASLSKSFTAVAALKLVEEGKLSLDDTVSRFIPGFPQGDKMTVHMLLSHTAGLPANFPRTEGMTLESTVNQIKGMKIQWEPGTVFNYSNCGYVIMAYIIEKASGQSYGSYMKSHVLNPLGMDHTGEASRSTPTIKGHTYVKKQMAEAPYYVSVSGTGTLYSTVDDLLLWNSAQGFEQLLSMDSLAKMLSSYSAKNYGYGLLIRNNEHGPGMTIYHNGSGTGYKTGMMRDTGTGLTVILLGNRDGLDTVPMMNEIMKLAR